MKHIITSLLIGLISISCGSSEKEATGKEKQKDNIISYAKNLKIFQHNDFSLVEVSVGEEKPLKYVLYKNQKPQIADIDNYIKVPIQSIACTSTSQLPPFLLLSSAEKLIGFQGTEWIYNEQLKDRVNKGKLKDIGQRQGINQELLLGLQPEVLMVYQTETGNNSYKLLEQTGIQIVYNLDYKESSPLGRAEWMKFTAALLGKTALADSIFQEIRDNYEQLSEMVKSVKNRPTVMTGIMYGDTWYVPGGKNYGSQFIADAGGKYIWRNDSSTKSLALGYENVLTKAKDADLWIGTASIDNYAALAAIDQRYTYFKPFENKAIFSYTKKVNQKGSNDYLESGYSRPDLILADHIKMIHPEIDTAKTINYTYFSPLNE